MKRKISSIRIRKKMFAIAVSFLTVMSISSYASAADAPADISMNYQESTDSFRNPERGFYVPVLLKLKESDTDIPENDLDNNMTHLRVDISDFGGTGKNLSDSALDALNQTLEIIENNGGTAIIRFSYDAYFSGSRILEPDLKMMKTHIRQVSYILEKHEPGIACIEAGMLGCYGEYHGTVNCTLKNRKAVIQAWLHELSSKFMISVRKPEHIAEWAGISVEQLCRKGTSKEGIERLGIYNDGYLGSGNDLGTYGNREDELDWLDEQTDTAFFGGEIVNYIEKDTPKNTAKYMESEGFITHTSYLNEQWNDTVIANLKDEVFGGKDSLYKGLSGFKYVENHLGYRFVLTDSGASVLGNDLCFFVQINNVGFGSMVKDKLTTILLESENKAYEFPLEDFDIRACKSQYKIRYQNFINISEAEPGDYKVYLRISEYGNYAADRNYHCVRFANEASQWNDLFGANLIGHVQIPGNEAVTDAQDIPAERTLQVYDLNRRFESTGGIFYKLAGKNAVIKRVDNKKSITIPASIVINGKKYTVTGLNNRLFTDCSKVQTVKIFNKTKEIPEGTFRNCRKMKSITFSKSIKKVAKGSLPVKSLKKIIYPGKTAQFDKLKLNWLHNVKVYTLNKTFILK